MEETISLQELFQTLKKRVVLILSLTILATLISGIVSYFFITPIYQASTQLLVNQERSETPTLNVGDIQTNLQLINTYNVIIKSPAILDIVRNELALDTLTTVALNSKITVSSVGESQVVTITAQDPDQFVARDIANTTASVFQREISKIMNVDNVSILSQAIASDDQAPIKPNKMLNMAIAMVVGLMLGVGIAFLLEYLDTTIKTEEQIEKLLNIPVIGAISSMDRKEQDKFDKFQQTRKDETNRA
ncbi:YveK family protein [Paenisporosarcina indica]|uniref:YveK family protein n=1 Tax=Paenisporosarcina indica TaxID=650093 RepID=UPI0009500B62|nr:Wzz/FepE/Etk N-terminal domain-containing protein [Paenisporosarcina indica]